MEKIAKQPRSIGYVVLIGILLLLYSCGSTKDSVETEQKYGELVQMLENRQFEISHLRAFPQQGNSINLIGNYNYIRVEGDSVQVHLPFFGVRHSGGGYGAAGGIEFEGPMEEFRIEKNQAKKEVRLRFSGSQGNENLDFFITLYSNRKVNTSVNSSQRSSISYTGEIEEYHREDR